LIADQVLFFDWIAGPSQVITLGEKEGVNKKAKFRRKLTPGVHVVDFSSDIFPVQLSLAILRNTNLDTLIEYSSFELNWKK